MAQNLKNKKLQLDCLLCLGYVAYVQEEYYSSKEYFFKASKQAASLNEKELA